MENPLPKTLCNLRFNTQTVVKSLFLDSSLWFLGTGSAAARLSGMDVWSIIIYNRDEIWETSHPSKRCNKSPFLMRLWCGSLWAYNLKYPYWLHCSINFEKNKSFCTKEAWNGTIWAIDNVLIYKDSVRMPL